MVRIISSLDEFWGLKNVWNEIVERGCDQTPFQKFEYVYESWRHFSGAKDTLHIILLIRQKDKLVQAIIPCYIDRNRRLRFINDKNTDFCNLIIRREYSDDYHLYEEFVDYYIRNASIRGLQFNNMTSASQALPYLAYFLKGSISRPINMYSDFNIPVHQSGDKTFIDSLSRLTSKEKYRLKNVQKKAVGQSLKCYSIQQGDDYPESIVGELIQNMVKAGIRNTKYFDDQMLSFFRNLYLAGLLSVFVTSKGEKVHSANLYFVDDNTGEYIDWIALYTEKKYNLDNILQTIGFISQKGGRLNFARGTYEYKIHNFRPAIHFLQCIHHSKNVFGKVGDLTSALKYFIRQIAKSIIRR